MRDQDSLRCLPPGPMEMDLETVEYIQTLQLVVSWLAGGRGSEAHMSMLFKDSSKNNNIAVNMLINEQVMNDRTRIYI